MSIYEKIGMEEGFIGAQNEGTKHKNGVYDEEQNGVFIDDQKGEDHNVIFNSS